jgi:hypothetical protein
MLVFWGAAIFGSVFFVLEVIPFVVGGFGAGVPDDNLLPDGGTVKAEHSPGS